MNNRDFLLHQGDCIAVMRTMATASVDSIVTDPPYELGFMGKGWDSTGIANSVEMWAEALRVLKPGGHLLAFAGSRTYHRMVCAIEDAGFEIRDQIMWVYGSGFPKSLDVSKAIDKAAGVEREVIGQHERSNLRKNAAGFRNLDVPEVSRGGIDLTAPATDAARQWQGWGTALKPAHEPICVARKPLIGTVAANVLQHGTGALNIGECRVLTEGEVRAPITGKGAMPTRDNEHDLRAAGVVAQPHALGRWPANLIHDGSDEVLAGFPQSDSTRTANPNNGRKGGLMFGGSAQSLDESSDYRDTGSAARFFYVAKASKEDREDGNTHPTVKPTDLMRHLVRLVTPPAGIVLDPFMGSGSTGKAAVLEGFCFVGIDLSPEYVAIAGARIAAAVRMGYQPSLNLEAA